jgi:hypothetical protein
MDFDIENLLKQLAGELDDDIDPDKLIEEAKSFFDNKDYWEEREREHFQEMECFTVINHNFPILYAIGSMEEIVYWDRINDYKTEILRNVGDDIQTFLDDKPDDLLGVTNGLWLCSCETHFVRSAYVTFCEKCKTCIAKPKRKFRIIP